GAVRANGHAPLGPTLRRRAAGDPHDLGRDPAGDSATRGGPRVVAGASAHRPAPRAGARATGRLSDASPRPRRPRALLVQPARVAGGTAAPARTGTRLRRRGA